MTGERRWGQRAGGDGRHGPWYVRPLFGASRGGSVAALSLADDASDVCSWPCLVIAPGSWEMTPPLSTWVEKTCVTLPTARCAFAIILRAG